MIIDLIKYFAKFPAKAGVIDMFRNESSSMPEYASLLSYINALPDTSVFPELECMVIATSLDAVKQYVSSFIGINKYLMMDYGEIISTPSGNTESLNDTMACAITVAMHLSDNADIMEQAIASAVTLDLANRLRAHMMADSNQKELGYFVNNIIDGQHTLVPFEGKEIQSIGWTLAFRLNATDMLDASGLKLQYLNN